MGWFMSFPPRAPFRARAHAVLAGLLLSVGLGHACYNPKVTSGGLVCSEDAAHRCPAGYTCASGHCWKEGEAPPETGGAGGGSGTGGATPQGGQGGGCATRTPLCGDQPLSGDVCQPTCQTGGCSCSTQCGVAANGLAACRAVGTKKVGDLCQLSPDDCAPGLVCLAETCGSGLARCYRFCRDVGDCDDVACSRSVKSAAGQPTAFRACDVPSVACDPIAQTGCADPAFVCYVFGPTSTRCDCPGGALSEGQSCSAITGCAPGLVCLGSGASGGTCQRLCRSSADCTRPDGGAPGACSPSGTYGTCVY